MLGKREKNTAKNKRAIVDALMKRIAENSFADIKIAHLCRDAGVSEASFYNYFPQKKDVLVYYIQLWSLETSWHAQVETKNSSGIKMIESIFIRTAESIRKHPQLMGEVVAFQAKMEMPEEWPELTEAEKLLAFPELKGVEKIKAQGLDGILPQNLQAAVEKGELPADTDIMRLVIALTSLFFGIPMLLHALPLDHLEEVFKQQLELIWVGARALGKDS